MCRVRLPRPGSTQATYLLLGRLILEAGVLDVIGPDGLALLVRGGQAPHGLGDGQPAALNVLAADPVGTRGVGCTRVTGAWNPPCVPRARTRSPRPRCGQLLQGRGKAHPAVNACWDEALS